MEDIVSGLKVKCIQDDGRLIVCDLKVCFL